jgi:hypothetical protein
MGCLALFLLPFALVGVGMAVKLVWLIVSWNQMQQWIETPAWIDRTELKQHHSDGSTSWEALAEYHYDFQDREYRGNRVWIDTGSDNSFQKQVYRELQEQQAAFRCYVNPEHPSESVLYRDLRPLILCFHLIFVVVFGGVGGGGICAIVHHERKSGKMRDLALQFPGEPWKWDSAVTSGVFRPKSRWAGWAVAALLWNMICWPVGLTVLRDLGQQQVVTSIVWLFLAGGIWLAWVALREYLRQRRYGEVLLEIQPWPYRAGHQLKGQIRFSEVIPEVPELAVELRVMEKVKGDDPDKEIFRETLIVPLTTTSTVEFSFDLPRGLPRSCRIIDSGNDRTADWFLKAKGSPGKSDFTAEFKLAVYESSSAVS